MIILSKTQAPFVYPLTGTLMGLDWGQKKVGYATADPKGISITPRGHFVREGVTQKKLWRLQPQDLKKLKQLQEEWEISHWILGWPVNKEGNESEASRNCLNLAQELERNLGGEIILVDEFLTSWEQKNSKDVDAGAAATILSDFFDQHARLQRSENKSGNTKVLLLVILGLVLLAAGTIGRMYYNIALESAAPPLKRSESFILDVKPGSTFASVRRDLENEGLNINPIGFRVWSRLYLHGKTLKVGEYRISKAWSVRAIFRELVEGTPILYKVVVKEGYHMWDILQAFQNSRSNQDTTALEKELNNLKHLESLDFLKTQAYQPQSLEGFLFPETYAYQKYDPPKKLVEAMITQFKHRALPILQEHPWAKEAGGIYRLLILASIVEKESGVKHEQPMIASVFWNRLAKRMKLQSDPTTIYGLLPNFLGNLTRSHLTTPSPWNTYTLPGLPVTPISNPGESALRAVVRPADTEFLFFVSRNDGSHVFSKDYKTHNSYVNEFQRKRRQKDPGERPL